MADISTELALIMSAVYGEDVRGSIHDAIELINNVSEKVISAGTAVTSVSSSSTGFYEDSLYVNTNTFDLWQCVGTDTWNLLGNLKGDPGADGNGIVSITKTGTSGLVDTYTITYDSIAPSTFEVTNGADGANGNSWYRGTSISGKAALPTVYPTGIADAHANDFYLNPTEGAIYHCVTGGADTVATWSYDFTMSGGGSSVSSLNDLTDVNIDSATLTAGQTIVFDGVEFVNDDVSMVGSLNDLSDVTITSPTTDQVLKYNGVEFVNATVPSGGGLLPLLHIESEDTATVTIADTNDLSTATITITPTHTGADVWEGSVPSYGVWYVHSVLAGQGDKIATVNVEDVAIIRVPDYHFSATITATFTSGATCTCTDGDTTLTASSNPYTFVVPNEGTWTVTASRTMDGNTKTDSASVTITTEGQAESVTLSTEFGTINLTVDQDFIDASSTITCAMTGYNTISKTATASMVFRVPSVGTWDISGTIGADTYTTTATVTSLSTAVSANLATIPDGSTVTPTDDVQLWLNCAGIYDKAYTTVSQVLADSTTLLALMSDNNAVDYLVRSTTFATGITAGSTAMTDIGANNYCADTLLANSTWCEAICNSTYFESVLNAKVPVMTSNTTPSGEVIYNGTSSGLSHLYESFTESASDSCYYPANQEGSYVGYDFTESVRVKKIYFKSASGYYENNWAIETLHVLGSNDKTTWTELSSFDNSTSYGQEISGIGTLYSQSNSYRYIAFNLELKGKASSYNYHRVNKAQIYCRKDV